MPSQVCSRTFCFYSFVKFLNTFEQILSNAWWRNVLLGNLENNSAIFCKILLFTISLFKSALQRPRIPSTNWMIYHLYLPSVACFFSWKVESISPSATDFNLSAIHPISSIIDRVTKWLWILSITDTWDSSSTSSSLNLTLSSSSSKSCHCLKSSDLSLSFYFLDFSNSCVNDCIIVSRIYIAAIPYGEFWTLKAISYSTLSLVQIKLKYPSSFNKLIKISVEFKQYSSTLFSSLLWRFWIRIEIIVLLFALISSSESDDLI